MDNFPYVINMFIHIVAVILYAGGVFYGYIFINRRNRVTIDDEKYSYIDAFVMREPKLWLYYLAVIIATGFGFGVLSIIMHGKPPEIAPVAFFALITMMVFSFISFAIVLFLMRTASKIRAETDPALIAALRRREESIILVLLLIVIVILFCAVSLRFLA